MANQIEGSKSPGQADNSSPPVKVGGVYNATLPTYADGQRADIQLDTKGALRVYVAGQDSTSALENYDQVLMAASSVSASTAVTATNFGQGIIAYAELTSGIPPGSSSVTFALKVQIVSPVGTNRFITLASTTAKSASGIVAVAVGPGLTETSGAAYAQANRLVPRNVRILASISSGAASFGMVLALGMSTIK